MDVNQFLVSLLHALSSHAFVEKVDLHTEVFILKGKVLLRGNRFLRVYFNEQTGTTAFALIEHEKRIWGIDFDNLRGWHLHPIDAPDSHADIDEKGPEEVISLLAEVWAKLL